MISLADADERRQSAAAQLQAAGVSFRFYDAIRGHDALSDGHLRACDEHDWLLHTGRAVTAGELGCYASHRNLWKRCIELDRPIVIMEDDFRLLDGFAEAIRQIDANIEKFGYLRLQTETRARKKTVTTAGQFRLCRYTKAPHSLMCYGIAPSVARAFVDQSETVCEPVDVFIKKFWQHGQPLYGLAPYTVTESALSIDTSIRGRVRDSKHPRIALRRFLTKIDWHLRRLWFNFRQPVGIPKTGDPG